ncbi:MAG TPA: DNA primase [Bacteroidales bacterium]|nr:DNA primase [Bacteroidales bacterium]HRR03898.1 DNA primase [Bacteroidales bacterium]HRT13672.1 DNA primase [Bacteroidales bacterium]HXK73908.1 DNA primase [Bacteroidales bacterium]
MISRQTIDEILLVAKIEDVVQDFVALKKRGQNWVGLCPFHDDRNPSMYVSPRLGIYKCFVCNAGGNAVNFLMEHEKISYPEALRYLAKKYNIQIQEERELSDEEMLEKTEKDSLFALNAFAENYFVEQMHNTETGQAIALSYFKERGYNNTTIQHFRLGYNPDEWDAFTQVAIKNGYKIDHLLKVGLTKKTENNKLFDFYRGRVIFPIHNTMGKIVGFGGRTLKKDDKIAKYFNSPESEIYHKSNILYGFYFAKKAIRAKDNVYLVEGYTDVISLYQAGIQNVVASSGTALTEGQIKIILSQTQNITILYDGDKAGIKAALRGVDMLLPTGLNVQVVLLPDGEDPDSFVKNKRDSEVADYLENNAVNFLLFKAELLSKEAGKDPIKRAEVVSEIVENIAEIRDNLVRAFYIKECANLFQIEENTLNVQLRKIVWRKLQKKDKNSKTEVLPQTITTPTSQKKEFEENLLNIIEKDIILLILKYGMYEIAVEKDSDYSIMRIDQYIFNEFHEDEIYFSQPFFQTLYEEYALIASVAKNQDEIKRYFSQHENQEIQQFVIPYFLSPSPSFSEEWEKRFDVFTHSSTNNIEKLNGEIIDHINMFKLRIIENYRKLLDVELKIEHDSETTTIILEKYMKVIQRRNELADLLGIVITK